jgi:hypothetical protein
MINNTFENTNVTFSKTQIFSDASDCSNDIEFPPPAFILKQQQQSLTFQ